MFRLVLAGWSFGADIALSCADPAIAGWLLVACPLRFARDPELVTADRGRSTWCSRNTTSSATPTRSRARLPDGSNAESYVVGGASHFFVGRTDHVIAHAVAFVDALAGAARRGSAIAERQARRNRLGGAATPLRSRYEVTLLERSVPGREIELEVGSVTVLVRVLELVERRILGIEQLAVPPEELLAVTVGVGHRTPSLVRSGQR